MKYLCNIYNACKRLDQYFQRKILIWTGYRSLELSLFSWNIYVSFSLYLHDFGGFFMYGTNAFPTQLFIKFYDFLMIEKLIWKCPLEYHKKEYLFLPGLCYLSHQCTRYSLESPFPLFCLYPSNFTTGIHHNYVLY